MRAGKLRHRLIIQQVCEIQTASGDPQMMYRNFATVWGAVEPLRGREFFAAHELQARVDIRVRVRYVAGVNPAMRVLFGSRIFEIVAVIEPEINRRELQLMCFEVV